MRKVTRRLNVLVGCEESGVVRDEFLRLGHRAWSCDLVPARNGGPHLQMCVTEAIVVRKWDIIILHPDCTALALCGNKHYGCDQPRNAERLSAVRWTVKLWKLAKANARIGVALENPASVIFRHLRAERVQYVQPYQFGHLEQKKTGLALDRLPALRPTKNVYRRMMKLPRQKRERVFYMRQRPTRKRDRSTTFVGIAAAMAEQWGRR